MTCNWPLVRASEFIEFNPKISLKKEKIAPKISMEDLTPFTKNIGSYSYAPYRGGSKFINGDVLFARITPCLENGKTAYVNCLNDGEVGFGSTEFIVLRAIKNISDPNFVYYLSISPQFRSLAIKSMVGSSGRQRVQLDALANYMFRLPPLSVQKTIANYLSSLDKKIFLNKQINDNLLALASTLFDQEVGKSGTNERKLGQIVDIHDSKRIPLSSRQRENMEKTYPYYGAASKMDYVDKYLFDGIYLLLGEDGTVISEKGFPILQYVWGKFWVNNHAHVLTGRNEITTEILYLLLSKTSVKNIVTGAVQPKINQENLKSLKVVLPSEKIIKELSNKIAPLFKLYRLHSEENKRLEKLRDILLSKLF